MLIERKVSVLFWLRMSVVVLLFSGIIVGGCSLSSGKEKKQTIPSVEISQSPARQEMKTIGIIGGISWVSSIEYYRLMNEMVQKQLGGLHSAKVLMFSIEFNDFAKEERLAEQGNWKPLELTMIDAAQRLERGGADFIVIASNTMNSTVDLIKSYVQIPIIHIADVVGASVQARGLKRVALLGTKYTMEHSFYRDHLEKKYNLEVVTPNQEERDYINEVIFDELCAGKIEDKSRKKFLEIIHRLSQDEHVQGVILGCTEIPLLIKESDVDIPTFDSTKIHVESAVQYALHP